MATRKLKGAQLRKFRSEIAVLKSKGLISPKVDARTVQPTSHMTKQIKKFQNVLTGKATVVRAGSRKQAKEYSQQFPTKFKSIVITKEANEKIRMNTKTGEISSYRNQFGKRIKKIYSKRKIENLNQLPTGPNVNYTVPFKRGPNRVERYTFPDLKTLKEFMEGYGDKYKDWMKYVEIEQIAA